MSNKAHDVAQYETGKGESWVVHFVHWVYHIQYCKTSSNDVPLYWPTELINSAPKYYIENASPVNSKTS